MVRSSLSEFALGIYLRNLIKGEKFSRSCSDHYHHQLTQPSMVVWGQPLVLWYPHNVTLRISIPAKFPAKKLKKSNWNFLHCTDQKDLEISMQVRFMMCSLNFFNPLTPISDQDRISPCDINTTSRRQVMRIKKNISERIISWSNIKFSKLTSQELYGRQ